MLVIKLLVQLSTSLKLQERHSLGDVVRCSCLYLMHMDNCVIAQQPETW